MHPFIHIMLLAAGILILPISYLALVFHLKRIKLDKPPFVPLFLIFGTIGGWILAFALSPSGLTAICIIFLVTLAPIALLISSICLSYLKNLTVYHRIPMWCGFAYPVALALFLMVGALLGKM